MIDPIEWLRNLLKEAPLEQRVNAAYGNTGLRKASPTKVNKAASVGIPAWLDSLYKSPLADSLYQTSDVPAHIGIIENAPEFKLGRYNGDLDILKMNPTNRADARNTLIHEMGHKYQDYVRADPSIAYNYPSRLGNNVTQSQEKAFAALGDYGTTHPHEGYAEAFRNAFNFLAETARDPKMDFRKFAGDLEANTPGMGLIVQDLMKLPIFAKHPLQGQMFREAPQEKKKK